MPTLRSNKPDIAITIGDPAGVGPEVVLKALASSKVFGLANFFVIGDKFVMKKIENATGLRLKTPLLDLSNVLQSHFSYGESSPLFGRASIQYINKGLELLKRREVDGLVTGPVSKSSVRASGVSRFEGHTEYLAEKTHTRDFAMMFVSGSIKATLVTRHIALRDVADHLSTDLIYRAIILTHKYLKKFFRIKNPKIGVSGLNPHAGENGLFGCEEKRIITPAIDKASRHIKGISGPVPPDIIFYNSLNKKYDAVIAMYHDQALIPFKTLYFKTGVNLTLGLPFIRTSPDHGTAFEIAGHNMADPSSMIAAISLASRLSGYQKIRQ